MLIDNLGRFGLETFFKKNERNKSRLLILDEIHKSKSWKQKLKGIYDHLGTSLSIIVIGSARLNVYNKGDESLMGRYLYFRLHPFSVNEVLTHTSPTPENFYKLAFSNKAHECRA
jgi:predicted AAA+ superfamily ATPase